MSGWDEHPHAGYPNGDPHELPTDLGALQADDALLDLIGSGRHIPSDTDDELTRVLAAWRREVHVEPVNELVDTRTALAAIRAAARRPAQRRHPLYGTAAAAAAVLVIAFSGVGLVAKSAQPGDHLWGVTEVLYSDYARSVETAATVRTELNEAKVALNQGHPEQARAALAHVQQQLPAVGESEGFADLTARHHQLEQRLNEPPETGQVQPPGMVFGPSMSNGAAPDATKSSDPSQSPASAGATTTTPGATPDMPDGASTTTTKQFMHGRDGYRYYGPGADMPGSSGQFDGPPGTAGPSTSGTPGAPGADGTPNGGAMTGAPPRVDSSTPSSAPDERNPAGPGPDMNHAGGPRQGGFAAFCAHAVPRPRFCGPG